MKKIYVIIGIFFIFGCATTYEAPKSTAPLISANHSLSKEELLEVSQRVLLLEGYQITHADTKIGVISTAPRNLKLTPSHADCGTTMGIDYLKDKRTDTDVSINVLVDKTQITIKANIQGEYKPGAVDQNITLSCVSRGVIERDILSKIKMQAGIK